MPSLARSSFGLFPFLQLTATPTAPADLALKVSLAPNTQPTNPPSPSAPARVGVCRHLAHCRYEADSGFGGGGSGGRQARTSALAQVARSAVVPLPLFVAVGWPGTS